MIPCSYLTDTERYILPPEQQDLYRFYAVFNLHGVRYIRWFYTDMDRATYLTWLHPAIDVVTVGEEPSRAVRQFREALLDSLGVTNGLRLWLGLVKEGHHDRHP